MSKAAIKLLRDAALDQEKMAKCMPALDDILIFALERRYLAVGEFSKYILEQKQELQQEDLSKRFQNRVRLIKIDEICYEEQSSFHLPGVESVISSMRDCGHSLIFLVRGEQSKIEVFFGISKFSEDPGVGLDAAIEGYSAAWLSHFPGMRLTPPISLERTEDVSDMIARAEHFGSLTGIPSLKRREEQQSFVQGLERMIRALRGHSYTWLSIADPVSGAQTDSAVESCRQLISDIHRLVKFNLSKGVSSGKTAMMGMFGLLGKGETDGGSYSQTTSETKSHTAAETQQELEDYQRAAALFNPASGAALGAIIGSIVPGIGTMIGASVGGILAPLISAGVKGFGAAATGKSGHANSVSDTFAATRAFTNTATHAVARQLAGGGFGSFGLTWTRTTSINQESLNRKAEYCEELLRKYENRLQTGASLGFWNVGHYFCSEHAATFNRGSRVISSMFAGMESHFEPPRIVKLPEEFGTIMRRFANTYLSFPNNNFRNMFPEEIPPDQIIVASHPLGFMFNGMGTPLNTQELAIATPLPQQDVEGITVSKRASFGVNLEDDSPAESLTVGTVLDRGEDTRQKYHFKYQNLPKHTGVFGLTGSGKTNTVFNILEKLWEKRIPFMVIEPAKSEYRSLGTLSSLEEHLSVISAGVERTSASPLRINPFEFDPGIDTDTGRVHVQTHIDRLKSVFNASFPMYASMPYILEEAILEVYYERGWDLGQSRNRYLDIYSETFHNYIPTLRDLYFKVDEVVRRKGYWVEQQMNIQAALKARLSSLMVGAKGFMLNCRKSIPSAMLFEKPTVIELRHLGDDDEKTFLMGLLISKLYEWRESCAGNGDNSNTVKHVLVIEEAHRLLKKIPEGSENMETANVRAKAVTGFVDMLAEVRAYGQGIVIVDQVPSSLHSNVVKGTAAKIVHRLLSVDDRQMTGNTMGLDDGQIEDLGLLKTGQCVVHQDGQRKAFMCMPLLNKAKDSRPPLDVNKGTLAFRRDNASIFKRFGNNPALQKSESELCNVETGDSHFCGQLHRIMLALPFSSSKEGKKALSSLIPARYALRHKEWPRDEHLAWLIIYWEQIADECWAYYRGNYRDFIAMRMAGEKTLTSWSLNSDIDNTLKDYAMAMKSYAGLPRMLPEIGPQSEVANVYDQLLNRTEAIVNIRERFRELVGEKIKTISLSIYAYVQTLLPPSPYIPPKDLLDGIIRAILFRITNNINHHELLKQHVLKHFSGEGND